MLNKMTRIDLSGIDHQRYRELLRKLKANEDNLTKDILKDQYMVPYNSLREELRDMTNKIILLNLKDVIWIEREQEDAKYSLVNDIIHQYDSLHKISTAVFIHKNFDVIEQEILSLRERVAEALAHTD